MVVLLKSLKVDGGGTHNKLLMQFQSDIINVPVVKPVVMETTSMGAAFAAGLAVGVWDSLDEIRQLWNVAETFKPSMTESEREKNWKGWNKAVSKSMNWIDADEEEKTKFKSRSLAFEDPGQSSSSGKSSFGRVLGMVLLTTCAAGAGFLLGQRHSRR